MEQLIGRVLEIAILKEILQSEKAELLALYGRRRVGKTYLVRQTYAQQISFELTGLKGVKLSTQLENFTVTLQTSFQLSFLPALPQNWLQAFRMLINVMEAQPPRKQKVVFFLDEFPWLDSPKSGFLPAFDHFWNSWASKQNNLVVVICGSAASWMIQNIVRSKGGLHNRITRRIRLLPFNLHETEKYLQHKKVQLSRYDILQLFMLTGGVPQYLNEIRKGESVAQFIDRSCFSNEGGLREEFQYLYPALFDHAEKHTAIVKALADKPAGLSRKEILQSCQLSSGGSFTKIINELMESGFITALLPFGKNNKELIYKLDDEYSLFYLKFIANSRASGAGSWLAKADSASWHTWSGFAFERICMKHLPQIKKALNILGVYTEQSVWRYLAKSEQDKGAQIDLVIDRKDHIINLIEIKFSSSPYNLKKAYAENILHKKQSFCTHTATRKTVLICMLSTFGVLENQHYEQIITQQIKMDALFEAAN